MPVLPPTSDHNQELVGDDLTHIALNYEWRRWLGYLIGEFFESRIAHTDDNAEIEARNRVRNLIHDLYTSETIVPTVAVRAINTANQVIPANTLTSLNFSSTDYDFEFGWSSGQPANFQIPRDGIYRMTANALFGSTVSSWRVLGFYKNGSLVDRSLLQVNPAISGIGVVSACEQYCVAGDTVTVRVQGNEGFSVFGAIIPTSVAISLVSEVTI
ncbi:MAG: hypothetical protein GWN00_08635 [Aliifodinibius sp.]|nr:hypothetical protein [Fodinibius sp.]NIY24868.1 hypothetical protein [Fodinibius sp.]